MDSRDFKVGMRYIATVPNNNWDGAIFECVEPFKLKLISIRHPVSAYAVGDIVPFSPRFLNPYKLEYSDGF